MPQNDKLLLGVDVGSHSVRAGLVDTGGAVVGRSIQPITVTTPAPLHYEQSSDEIWAAVCRAIREAVSVAGVDPGRVAALAFDATSSVALFDSDGRPVGASTTND